jgi:hypothetical protein
VLAALDDNHVACIAALLSATRHCPSIAASTRVGHAARKVVFAALRGAGSGVGETTTAGAGGFYELHAAKTRPGKSKAKRYERIAKDKT